MIRGGKNGKLNPINRNNSGLSKEFDLERVIIIDHFVDGIFRI